jgi:predicted dehydrogenase
MSYRPLINIGIVGCGRVAQHYKGIFGRGIVKNYLISAVCDIEPQKANLLGSELNAKSFYSLEEMLRHTQLDLVLVLTPSGLHYSHSKAILDSGASVLVEKPAAMFPAEIEELASLAMSKGLMYSIVFQNRLNPAMVALKDAVDKGRFGKVVTVSVRLKWCRYDDYYQDGWHGTWEQDGGVLNQQGIHHIDAMNWVFGPVSKVVANAARMVNDLEAEDTITALVEFSNGSFGTIEMTTAARPRDFEASISVVGSGGSAKIGGIALNNIEEWEFVESSPLDQDIPSNFSEHVETGYGNSHGPLIQSVIDSICLGSITPPFPIGFSVATSELVHAIYVSHELKSWVELNSKPISKLLGALKKA